MFGKKPAYETINEYIKLYPAPIQTKLKKIRDVIKEAAPKATQTINYGMPTFQLNGNLVHFAAYKNHIGFYPAPSGIAAFKDELSEFKVSTGAIQFPLDKPIPYSLVKKITKFRVKENLAKAKK